MVTKYCPRCEQTKDTSEFSRNRANRDGLSTYCRLCYREVQRLHHEKKHAATPAAPDPLPESAAPQPPKPLPFKKSPPRGDGVSAAQEQRNVTELAVSTFVWARNVLAFENQATGGHGHFTVREWCERFGQSASTWLRVQREIARLGYPLALDPFNGGYYFGTLEEQARSVAGKIKTALAMIEQACLLVDAVKDTKEWGDLMGLIDQRMEASRYDAAVRDLPRMAQSARVPVSGDFERKLLASGE